MVSRALTKPWTLSALKASQLKYATFLMGLPSAGSKSELENLITEEIARPSRALESHRVLSVDMGIRNLAFCTLDVPKTTNQPWKVKTWKRVDLLEGLSHANDEEAPQSKESKLLTLAEQKRRKSAILASVSKTAFNPSSLSVIAHKITRDLLSYQPDTVLIERQRFRSGGAAAIQEWTVRVNMLESMIWACMETIRHSNDTSSGVFPSTIEVNPARVARFWSAGSYIDLLPPNDLFLGGVGSTEMAKLEPKKIDKQEKIDVVRRWATNHGDSENHVSIEFEGEAAKVAKAFETKEKLSGSATRKRDAVSTMGKLDDLADCLLQAGAFVRWSTNQQRIRNLVADAHIQHGTEIEK
ncbi:ribonuclease H-like protein [Acrodontium crateriforme]|uniref:Ribonuclease H-like protein n=1 Tax=Acrodontium crateriforme TaxID=150365 RepID=A0AAQ3M466_9PEZI|nr:ribonuclease H-like protein [Acrodontium crateriforme]